MCVSPSSRGPKTLIAPRNALRYSSHKAMSSHGPARVVGFLAHDCAMQTARWQRHHSIPARAWNACSKE